MLDQKAEFHLDEIECELLPTREDVERYRECGYYVSNLIFSDAEIDELIGASDVYYDGKRDRPLPFVPDGATYWRPGDETSLRQNNYVTYESNAMRRILLKPLMGAIVSRLMGTDEVRLLIDVMRYKGIGQQKETTVGWHIDRHYWQMFTSDNMITAFIPLHDCMEEHGTIIMIDGSSRWKEAAPADDSTSLHFAKRELADLEDRLEVEAESNGTTIRKRPMLLKRGQVSFHHSFTFHGSLSNVSTIPRRTFSLHFQDKDNAYRRYPLKDGRVAKHHTEDLCRKLANGDPDYSDPEIFPTVWRE